MRYKCVIPMVMDEEAKQREQRQKIATDKEKEEEVSIVKIEDEYVNEAEINESKNRVHQHFKQVTQINKQVEIPPKQKKKSKQLILNQIQDRKRKRECDSGNKKWKKNDSNDFSMTTPTPYLDTGIVHVSKKAKQKVIEERKVQEDLAQIQDDNNSEAVKSIR